MGSLCGGWLGQNLRQVDQRGGCGSGPDHVRNDGGLYRATVTRRERRELGLVLGVGRPTREDQLDPVGKEKEAFRIAPRVLTFETLRVERTFMKIRKSEKGDRQFTGK